GGAGELAPARQVEPEPGLAAAAAPLAELDLDLLALALELDQLRRRRPALLGRAALQRLGAADQLAVADDEALARGVEPRGLGLLGLVAVDLVGVDVVDLVDQPLQLDAQ